MSFNWIALFLKTPAEIFCRWMMIIRSHMATRLRQDLHQCLSLHLCCWSGGCAFVRSATSGRVEPTSGSRGSGAGRFGRWGDKETCGIMWKMMYWSYPQNLLLDFTVFYENSYFCRVHSILGYTPFWGKPICLWAKFQETRTGWFVLFEDHLMFRIPPFWPKITRRCRLLCILCHLRFRLWIGIVQTCDSSTALRSNTQDFWAASWLCMALHCRLLCGIWCFL